MDTDEREEARKAEVGADCQEIQVFYCHAKEGQLLSDMEQR